MTACRPIACLLERRGLASLGVAERTHRAGKRVTFWRSPENLLIFKKNPEKNLSRAVKPCTNTALRDVLNLVTSARAEPAFSVQARRAKPSHCQANTTPTTPGMPMAMPLWKAG
eukprot:SAG31_NODE_3558_length_4123_cov_4.557654_4_plen_114_part_00